jgi:hypothetical protein
MQQYALVGCISDGPRIRGIVTRVPATSTQNDPSTAAEAVRSLAVLTDEFGLGLSDIGDATGIRPAALRAARRGAGEPNVLAAGRLANLVRVLQAAVTATGADPCDISSRLTARLDEVLAPRLLAVFADERRDLVAAALTGELSGLQVLDVWRPAWRTELVVSRYAVVEAGDGHRSLVLRPDAEGAADEARLGIG